MKTYANRFLRRGVAFLLAALMIALMAHSAVANTYTWINAGTTGWGNVASWTPGTIPAGGDVAVFNANVPYVNQPTITSGNTRRAALWDIGSGTISISGAGVPLSGTTISPNSNIGLEMDTNAGNLLLSIATVTATNNQTWLNNSATGILSVTGKVNGGNTITIAGCCTTLCSGSLAGAGSLTMNGAGGLLTLSNSGNTFSGVTTVSAGTLLITNSLALQDSTLNENALTGTLSFGTLNAVSLGGLTGSQSFDLDNAGSPLALSVGGNTTTYTGVLSGAGSFTKVGAGSLTLLGPNTYAGSTTVAAGTLILGTNALPGGPNYSQNIAITGSTAVLNYAGSTAVTFNGAITGSGEVALSGNTSLTLTGTDICSTVATAGTLNIAPTAIVTDTLSSGGLEASGSNAVINIQGVYNKPANAAMIMQGGGIVKYDRHRVDRRQYGNQDRQRFGWHAQYVFRIDVGQCCRGKRKCECRFWRRGSVQFDRRYGQCFQSNQFSCGQR